MLKFIGKRLLMMIPVILGISFIIFAIMALTPGNPAQMKLGENATPEAIAELEEEMGLNENFFVRYFKYMGNALRGDLGNSYRTELPVAQELMSRFPNTLILAFFGIGLAVVIGIPIGILSAVKQYTIIDTVSLGLALVMTSIPAFWLGLMLMLTFSLKLDLLPAVYDGTWTSFILPCITLAIGSMATLIRMTRSTMLEVIREDYIRTARAKGAPEKVVIFRHALRNALLPVVTTIGINFGLQLGGAVICESVFSIQGLGTLMITSVRQKDVPMVMAAVLFVALTISIVNLLIDILYTYIDPRVKSQYIKAR
ncbi:ABC transporter permease [Feifania hominis]|uniref:ABC transporter permease n=1 Tax=Feifania hominis TaxID=2763660 RepID=A0A926DDM2_9FIRM|nr:ABC transporter permease [Feifania hominis]MBC8537025.1 ABC transporter permease [Feifania hominis]